MKNITIVSCTAFLLGSLLFCSCNSKPQATAVASPPVTVVPPATSAGTKIAYVNIDSLEANYELLKTKREEFKKRQASMENELQRSYQQMQGDAAEVQKKAQANTLTQSEYDAAQKHLMQMQQSLETRKQSLTDQLVKEQDDFNKDLKARLDAFLNEYNKDRRYDYILSYSAAGSSILYVNKQLDITKDVVAGMNATAKNDDKKERK
jgi:outer membrane protein